MPITPALLLALALPQGPERGTLTVRVTDAAGQPWAGATVHAYSCPLPERPQLGSPEHLQGDTDDHGRLELEVRRDRSYALWAVQTIDERSYRASTSIDEARLGGSLQLQDLGTHHHRRIVLDGLAAWRDGAPFRYRILSRGRHRIVIDGELDAEDSLVLPALPGSIADVVIRDANDHVLAWLGARLDRDQPLRAGVQPARQVLVRVRDAETGAAIAGATLWRNTPWGPERVGALGADGTAELRLPIDPERVHYSEWRVRAPDRCTALLAVDHKSQDEAALAVRARGDLVLGAGMSPGHAVTGRLVTPRGAAMAGVLVHVVGHTRSQFPDGGSFADDELRVATTDAEGRFAIAGLPPDEPVLLRATLDDRVLATLPDSLRTFAGEAVLAMDRSEVDLGDIVLGRTVRAMRVQWELPDGRPAGNVATALLPPRNNPGGPSIELRADPLGRTDWWLPEDTSFDLVARHEEGVFVGRLRIRADAEPRIVTALRLQTGHEIHGVVQLAGNPFPGASVSGQLATWSTDATAADWPPAQGIPTAGLLAETLPAAALRTTTYKLIGLGSRCISDAEGRFRLRLPTILGKVRLHAYRRDGERSWQGERQIETRAELSRYQADVAVEPAR